MPESTTAAVLTRHRTAPTEPPSTCVQVTDVDLPEIGDGQVLIRTTHVQLAAVFADLMAEAPRLPMPPYAVGQPIGGPAVGTVLRSRSADLAVGAVVHHMAGWRELVVLDAAAVSVLPEQLPAPEYALNQGVTAYHGLVDVAQVGEGDVVFVSGAAGGVGSMAVQIARLRGASRVVGTAGSERKCAYLTDELGVDVALDYHAEDLAEQLRAAAPDGIDVFFDLVGGAQFEAAVPNAAEHARFALCGALAEQVGGEVGRPRLHVLEAILHEIRILPFRTFHTPAQLAVWNEQYARWLAADRIVVSNTVLDGGLTAAVDALDGLLAGEYHGNVIVRLES